MKTNVLKWVFFGLIAFVVFIAGVKSYQFVESQKAKKAAVQDSITELNQLIVLSADTIRAERSRYWGTIHFLDSISKVNGVGAFTNSDNQNFEIRLTPKK